MQIAHLDEIKFGKCGDTTYNLSVLCGTMNAIANTTHHVAQNNCL